MNATFIRFDEPLPKTLPSLTKQEQNNKKKSEPGESEDLSKMTREALEAKIETTQSEREIADKKYIQQYRELTKQRMPEKSKEKQLAPLIHIKKQLDNWLRILRAWVDEKTEPYEKVPLTSKYRQHKM